MHIFVIDAIMLDTLVWEALVMFVRTRVPLHPYDRRHARAAVLRCLYSLAKYFSEVVNFKQIQDKIILIPRFEWQRHTVCRAVHNMGVSEVPAIVEATLFLGAEVTILTGSGHYKNNVLRLVLYCWDLPAIKRRTTIKYFWNILMLKY